MDDNGLVPVKAMWTLVDVSFWVHGCLCQPKLKPLLVHHWPI